MFKTRKNRILEYADLAPLAYLHIALDGNNAQSYVKHLLIDEMQDYSPIQYKVIQKLYPCRKTILGDASQSVNPYGSSTAGMIQKAFVTGEIMKLCKSYRSTFEITSFAQKIQSNNELEPIMRHGEHPKILPFKSTKEEIQGIADLVNSFRNSPLYLIRDHLQNRIPSKRTCSKTPDICKRHLTFVKSKFCLCERDYHHFCPYGERTRI